MNYKDTLYFVAQCLTINHEKHNYKVVEKTLQSGTIDWDAVVKRSTAHYVFPALYCNLKKANFLEYLPTDLVEYMIHLTELNSERNQQIIEQAKEINELLLANNITPIFLKGTGNLLEGLYDDISERMVGDIDFIVSKDEYQPTINLLTEFNYNRVNIGTKFDFPQFKHYHRLKKKNNIAAIEIHKELLKEEFANEFNYNVVKKDSQIINGFQVLSYHHQFALSVFAKQINDNGMYYNNIALRNAYDVFLLSKKIKSNSVYHQFNTLKNPLNCFIAISKEVFNHPESLQYTPNTETQKYVNTFLDNLENDVLRTKNLKKIERKLFIKQRLFVFKKSLFDKNYRNWVIKRLSEKNWYSEKLGLIKGKLTKPNS